MKYSLKSSFSRLVLAVFVAVFFVTILGRIVTMTGAWAFCIGWPVCVPTAPLGYLKLAHIVLVGVASVLMVLLLRKAWREQRDQNLLLPLTTVTGVLFFGQALIGAIIVTRAFPLAFGGLACNDRNCLVDLFGCFGFHIGRSGKRCD